MESPLTARAANEDELEARRAAEELGERFLVYRDDDGRQVIHTLASATVTIGRRREADISIPWDPEMSRLHAELSQRAGEWTICDDGLSQNGTGINPASDEEIAEATGIPLEAVVAELDHLGRAFGLDDMPHGDQRAEIALLAMRSGLVSADEGG